jgi:hypothetical protein
VLTGADSLGLPQETTAFGLVYLRNKIFEGALIVVGVAMVDDLEVLYDLHHAELVFEKILDSTLDFELMLAVPADVITLIFLDQNVVVFEIRLLAFGLQHVEHFDFIQIQLLDEDVEHI